MWVILFPGRLAVASYADDTTSYGAKKNDLVIKEIAHFSKVFLNGLTLTKLLIIAIMKADSESV